MCDEDERIGGDRAISDRAIADRRTAGRGLGSGSISISRSSSFVPEFAGAEPTVELSIGHRQRFLSDLTPHLQEATRRALESPTLMRYQGQLATLQAQFEELMRRQPQPFSGQPPQLQIADRRRALQILDEAYEVGGRGYDSARRSIWRQIYSDSEARSLIDDARRSGLIQLSDIDIENSRTPRFLDFDGSGRASYINIDHSIPRERVPFYALRPENLFPQAAQFNQVWLRRFSLETPFPMGIYGRSDAIEEFVQANQLSRTQRPEPRSRRSRRRRDSREGVRIAQRAAQLLIVAFVLYRQRTYAQAASDIRASLYRRTEESRVTRRIQPHDIDLYNVEERMRQIFDREPLEVLPERAYEFRVAVENWFRQDYQERGRGLQAFEASYQQAMRSHDPSYELSRLLIQEVEDEPRITGAIATARHFLTFEEGYLRRIRAAEELNDLQTEILQDEAEVLAITVDDMMILWDYSQEIANSYRRYVDYLRTILRALETIRQVKHERRLRLEAEIPEASRQGGN